MKQIFTILFFIQLFFLGEQVCRAQQQASTSARMDTTAKESFVDKMQIFAKKASVESKEDFEADKAEIEQFRILAEIKMTSQQAKTYLQSGIDTAYIRTALTAIQNNFKIAGDGVFTNNGSAQTFRNLTTTSKILTELLKKAILEKEKLDLFRNKIISYRYKLDSLLSSPPLFKFQKDSAELVAYIRQLQIANYEINPVDSALKQSNRQVVNLLNLVNQEVIKLQSSLEEIQLYQKDMRENSFSREFASLYRPLSYYRPFGEIVDQAKSKGLLTLIFYFENHKGLFICLFVLVGVVFFGLRYLRKTYEQNELLKDNLEDQLILKYPFYSSVLIVLNLFQFVFISPPFIINLLFWLTSALCLSIIFRKYITTYWLKVWLAIVGLFTLASFDNLILQASRTERWFMLVLAFAGMLAGSYAILRGRRYPLKEKWIQIAIGLMVVLEFFSMVANLFGRYNISKALLISGFLNVIIAIHFLWTIRLINEGLTLAYNAYISHHSKPFIINFNKIGKKVPLSFYILLIAGWMILFGRNFAGFEYLVQPLANFFIEQRRVGDYEFSIYSIGLFIFILVVAVVVSKVVSFFAADRHLPLEDGDKGIGSWLLLIRIGILSIGLFLALAAAGIPLDRLTIVVGALGVGIGFGLQTLVNNLVSGLIIAFEKPVNVGDVVDIDGQGGTMKSIGFRSSVIKTFDGADMIMPNGDILSSHLINWSLAGNRRRMTIALGVAYDADLNMVRELVMTILTSEQRISKRPAPVIQYEQFGNSSIELKIYFWTESLKNAALVKSDLIVSINSIFKEKNIVIPIPQQDIYIHNLKD